MDFLIFAIRRMVHELLSTGWNIPFQVTAVRRDSGALVAAYYVESGDTQDGFSQMTLFSDEKVLAYPMQIVFVEQNFEQRCYVGSMILEKEEQPDLRVLAASVSMSD